MREPGNALQSDDVRQRVLKDGVTLFAEIAGVGVH